MTFNENLCNWDEQFDVLIHKANSRLYILQGWKIHIQLLYSRASTTGTLYDSLIMTTFLYGIEVWASAYADKYNSQIDKFCRRAVRFGYTAKYVSIHDIRSEKR